MRHRIELRAFDLPVNSVDTSGVISTRIAVAFIHVDFTVWSRCTRFTDALITINQILANPSELAGITFAFIDLSMAQMTSVARMAHANERVFAIDTFAVLTWR